MSRDILGRLTNSINVCLAHNFPHKMFSALSREQSQLRCRLLGCMLGPLNSSTLRPYHSPFKPHIRKITKYPKYLLLYSAFSSSWHVTTPSSMIHFLHMTFRTPCSLGYLLTTLLVPSQSSLLFSPTPHSGHGPLLVSIYSNSLSDLNSITALNTT